MSQTVFTREQIKNCDIDEIVIAIFEFPSVSVYTRERRFCRVCSLAFQSGEKKRGSLLCSDDMVIDISFEIEFLFGNVWFIGQSG